MDTMFPKIDLSPANRVLTDALEAERKRLVDLLLTDVKNFDGMNVSVATLQSYVRALDVLEGIYDSAQRPTLKTPIIRKLDAHESAFKAVSEVFDQAVNHR